MRALQPLKPRRRPACSVADCCAGVIRVMHELMAAEAGAGPIMTQRTRERYGVQFKTLAILPRKSARRSRASHGTF